MGNFFSNTRKEFLWEIITETTKDLLPRQSNLTKNRIRQGFLNERLCLTLHIAYFDNMLTYFRAWIMIIIPDLLLPKQKGYIKENPSFEGHCFCLS